MIIFLSIQNLDLTVIIATTYHSKNTIDVEIKFQKNWNPIPGKMEFYSRYYKYKIQHSTTI